MNPIMAILPDALGPPCALSFWGHFLGKMPVDVKGQVCERQPVLWALPPRAAAQNKAAVKMPCPHMGTCPWENRAVAGQGGSSPLFLLVVLPAP